MRELDECEILAIHGGRLSQWLAGIAIYEAITDFAEGFAAGVRSQMP